MDTLIRYRQAAVMRDAAGPDGRIAHKWRLVRQSEAQAWELYDVAIDPKQAGNLAAAPEHTGLIRELGAAYERWWATVSARAGEYVRPILGAAEPVACLYSHDWHSNRQVPFNQTMVAAGMRANGFNAVAFAQPGSYIFDLRRWPREIEGETTATSALRTPILANRTNLPIYGVTLPIHAARLRIWHGNTTYLDETRPLAAGSDGVTFAVAALPAGPALVQTWFHDAAGNELGGAYHTYVEHRAP